MGELILDIIADLTVELKDDVDFNQDILAVKVKNAVREVRQRKNYSATKMSEGQIVRHMRDNYYHVCCNVARYDYNMIGVEGQTYSMENGNTRTWANRNSLFEGLHPYVKVL